MGILAGNSIYGKLCLNIYSLIKALDNAILRYLFLLGIILEFIVPGNP